MLSPNLCCHCLLHMLSAIPFSLSFAPSRTVSRFGRDVVKSTIPAQSPHFRLCIGICRTLCKGSKSVCLLLHHWAFGRPSLSCL